MKRFKMALAVVGAMGLLGGGGAQDAKEDVTQEAVDRAVAKGAEFLMQRVPYLDAMLKALEQANKGDEGSHGLKGLDALVLYALVHAGEDRSGEDFQGLVTRVAKETPTGSYQTSLRAMALESLDGTKYRKAIAECAQFLVDNQCRNGQWSYGKPVDLTEVKVPEVDESKGGSTKALPMVKIKKRGNGPERGDNSNTQYAVLGLRACADVGIEIPKGVFEASAKRWVESQREDGGWDYSATDSSYGSMTAGGVGSLIILRRLMGEKNAKDRAVEKGVEWMAKNFSARGNPARKDPSTWHLYWLYALERVGTLHETELIGEHKWYAEGAKWLLENQGTEGAWGKSNPLADTCFAILFLRRATKPLPPVKTVDDRERRKR